MKWTRVKSSDFQARIDVDLFCLSADKKTSRLNEIQKLKLIGIICTFFLSVGHAHTSFPIMPICLPGPQEESLKDRQLRHLYFDVIFCGREGETQHETRIAFLTKFSVMFLQYPVYALFDDIAKWLNKVGASKPYGERIVGELCDKFVAVPPHYEMHEYLIPLWRESPDFAAIFVVHSIGHATGWVGTSAERDGNSERQGLVKVIGEWLSDGWKTFLTALRESAYLREKFASLVGT